MSSYYSQLCVRLVATLAKGERRSVAEVASAVCADYFGEKLYAELRCTEEPEYWLLNLKEQNGTTRYEGECFGRAARLVVVVQMPDLWRPNTCDNCRSAGDKSGTN